MFGRVRVGARFAARLGNRAVMARLPLARAGAAAAGVVTLATLASAPVWCREQPAVNWVKVREQIVEILDSEDHMEEPPGPQFVRLAWHSAGTYCKHTKTGGSDAATMRYGAEGNWGANAGLAKSRGLLEEVKVRHPNLSYADLWVFAAIVAIEEMGGPKIPFKPGRTDKAPAATPTWTISKHAEDGRLPSADMGADAATAAHLRNIFNRMGFNDQEIVALSGAHALGRCHTDASGYWGPWTYAPTTMSNEYYRLLFDVKWTEKKTHEGKPWTGPRQFENPAGDLMMLPSDLVLIKDPSFRKYAEAYAKDDDKFKEDFGKAFEKLVNLGFA
mmetsp:Transcript_8419/g.20940  ORF Transcript_8419/g.20940 Transcript_8419/m.20940 type:complete len:331 (+) Transcript_8419:50-1042(+)